MIISFWLNCLLVEKIRNLKNPPTSVNYDDVFYHFSLQLIDIAE